MDSDAKLFRRLQNVDKEANELCLGEQLSGGHSSAQD